ncbi:hypothetical protein DBR06_SOUSAS110240, partial [Sousa chinensis]
RSNPKRENVKELGLRLT